MTYTLLKGKQTVETEYRLGAICYNLKKSLSVLGWKRLKASLAKLVSHILSQIWLYLGQFKGFYSEIEDCLALKIITR